MSDVFYKLGERENQLSGTLPPTRWSLRDLPFSYPLEAITIGFFVVVGILWLVTGVPLHPFRPVLLSHLGMTSAALTVCLFVFAIVRSVRGARRGGWKNWKAVFRRTFPQHFQLRVLARSLRFLILAGLVLVTFTVLKQAIPLVNPQQYDEQLIAVESWLHGGLNPAWFFAEHPGPLLWVRVLDYAYSLWFPLLPLTAVYFLLHRNQRKCSLYLSSFLALWPAGVLFGLLFPSHGPCYVDPSSFPAPGMLYCSEVQAYLYGRFLQTTIQDFNLSGDLRFGCGLMALPSHHVAFAFLYLLFFWGEGAWLRYFSLSFLFLTFAGSIYSGWHYAIDGYAGILITLLVVLPLRYGMRRSLCVDRLDA